MQGNAGRNGLHEINDGFAKKINSVTSNRRPESVSVSMWCPMRQPLFCALWIASLTSNLGTWMHEAAAGWP